ncbi:MAG: phenylalanine--tRNA ligase subunit beta [Bacteroidota bacterium]
MKISYNWLKSYLNIDLPADTVARHLTFCGLEVEGVETVESVKGGLRGLVVGEVKTCVRHPNADKLSLTTVDVGGETPLSIVCGAPNVAAGQKVIVATVGTTVYPLSGEPFEIKKSKIRGEVSEGMICAEDEIGMGASHAGILVLPADTPVGKSVREYFGVTDDVVFEIGLTPNRVDAASHIGVARDLAAVLRTEHPGLELAVELPSHDGFPQVAAAGPIRVDVRDAAACPRYSGLTIEGVTVTESPDWLKTRLKAIGVGPINNVVDVTNFVLHECGQPLHAFDADTIRGGTIVVRRANAGEKFVTLDGVERTLSADNLMICDTEKPLCMAGVFGGLHSGISEKTTNVFLESAYFAPGSVRKTAKEHGLKTDSSFRFERGADPNQTLWALKRAAQLICEVAGGSIRSAVTDTYPQPIAPARVELRFDYLNRFAGAAIPEHDVRRILADLGFAVESNEGGLRLEVPTNKVDVTRPVDVVEEVLRIYGYNRIPLPAKLSVSLPSIVGFDADSLQAAISAFLASNGFFELFTNSLTKEQYAERPSVKAEEAVRLLNPLSGDLGMLRLDMLPTGLEAIAWNRNRKQADVRFYEFGKSYHKLDGQYTERRHLALYLCGRKHEPAWNAPEEAAGFFYLKAMVEQLLQRCGIDKTKWKEQPTDHPELAQGLAWTAGEKTLVRFGMVKRSVAKQFDIQAEVAYADIDWDLLLQRAKKKPVKSTELSKFPPVRRDLSMVLDRTVSYAQLEALAFKTEKKLLRSLNLFDVYEGDKIEAGKKSYAISFLLQDDTQTLTDQQIDKVMERLMSSFEGELGAVIRRA